MKQDMILILDLGSEQNAQIAREIRALGVYSEIHPHDITLAEVKALPNVKGIILNGGPNRVVDGVEVDVSRDIYNCDVPVLLADHKGDAPWPADEAERGQALSNFVFGVCGAQANWNMENFIADQVELIRRQVGWFLLLCFLRIMECWMRKMRLTYSASCRRWESCLLSAPKDI